MIWTFGYFFTFLYVLFIFVIVLYLIPSVKEIFNTSFLKNKSSFEFLTGADLYWMFLTPLALLTLISLSWSSSSTSAWFGNLIFTSFHFKFFFFFILFIYFLMAFYSTSFFFSTKEIYDYVIINYNLLFWLFFLFFSNNAFTVIFFIEILSTLVFLLIISSTFSTTFFYNNLNLNLHSYFAPTTPLFFLQTLMAFFWISLIGSLNLFFFLILFYLKFFTFDFWLFENLFLYITSMSSTKELFFYAIIWLNLLFCIFLKCGLVPFYFWKPIFFKGMPFHAIFFYIFIFYFFLFLFLLNFLMSSLNEIFFFFVCVNLTLLLFGFFFLLFVLCEAYYLKSFFALSSILNTLFVFLALTAVNVFDFFFFL